MFTGLIEAVGRVVELKPSAGGFSLRLASSLAAELTDGDSLAVNGVCLTVGIVGSETLHADIGPETARVTTLGTFQAGRLVNLERPMRADARFGGHFVQGHVDDVGVVEGIRREGDAHWLTIGFPASAAPLLVQKGSITVDGVSLTIAGLADRRFDVMIIPYTWLNTAFSSLAAGERVNLEFDIVGKYVVRIAELTAAGHLRPSRT